MSFGRRLTPAGDPNSDRERNPEVLAVLIARVAQKRDRDAFRALFHHFALRLKAFFLRRGLEDGSADGLAQETMLRIWHRAAQFDPFRAAPSAWVFGIARNLRVDTLRFKRGRSPDLDDLSHDEARRALGIPLGTLKTRLRLALAHLRDALDEPQLPAAAAVTPPIPPRSHPSELALLLFATGRLGPVFRTAVAAHAASCARCGALLRKGEALGGMLLANGPSVALAPGALDAALAHLDEPASPPSIRLPALLARHVWPGARHARLLVAEDESLHLFRVRPGASLPAHDHGGDELTCVLEGAFADATGVYAAGDAIAMRPGLAHEPVAIGGADCVCLLAVSGRLRFAMPVPRFLQRFLGL